MSQPHQCFVDEVSAPIKLIDVLPLSRRELSTVQEIEEYISHTDVSEYSHRHLSICQRTSWRPLQVTRGLLELFVSKHDITDSFWDLPSCFYYRSEDVEINFCLPVNMNKTASSTEICYTIRYPELKPDGRTWVIRQSGFYFRIDAAASRSVSVLFSPTPNSTAHRQIEDLLLSTDNSSKSLKSPLRVHEILFSAYFPAWRHYIAFLELKLISHTSATFTSFIDEPLRVGHETLSSLTSLDSRFLQASTLLSLSEDLLRELSSAFSQEPSLDTTEVIVTIDNYRRQVVAYYRTTTFLQRRAQTTAQLAADTLSLRDQVLAKQQNSTMLQLNKSAVFLTMLTLLYLPASFVATFFGMNFFDLDQDSQQIVSTPMVWIYVVSSVMLTLVTFSVYYWVVHNDVVVKRMSPKIHVGDWRALARRALTMRANSMRGLEKIPV
ncbi:hypothetical protein F4821DRAFT_257052 [Hypoxylon rubiginosum]|uniref:Uncharacterized protein n=1 Tax=Hypoxylon rubiginosum TaxID=110542 RepID=A0ACC0D9C4_9PEZI|nr:hypothetical protein F4821DRAFT_257052 [Hypoxylon rubiginosum]